MKIGKRKHSRRGYVYVAGQSHELRLRNRTHVPSHASTCTRTTRDGTKGTSLYSFVRTYEEVAPRTVRAFLAPIEVSGVNGGGAWLRWEEGIKDTFIALFLLPFSFIHCFFCEKPFAQKSQEKVERKGLSFPPVFCCSWDCDAP